LAERAGAPGGGGRKPTVEKDVTLLADLEALVEPTSRGDPECAHWSALLTNFAEHVPMP
jgi:hypothetical protein